jgi:stage II sporulation protein P
MKLKSNKSKLKKIFKFMIITIIFFYAFDGLIKYIYSKNISNEEFILLLLNDKIKSNTVVNNIVKFVSNVDLKNPVSLLSLKKTNKKEETVEEVNEDLYDYEALEKLSDYISDPNPVDITKPRIYIYNSHQLENYSNENLEIYNITPNVLMGAYLLKEKFNKLGIPTVVEDSNMAEFMRVNAWSHADSYKASRLLILDKKSEYDTIEYYIDFHRDSVKKDVTTATIKNKKYAKTLFVVGLENPNYENNLKLANELHKKINEKYPNLSRGVYKKQGAGVNGVYNQDISPNMVLLEVGGVDNTIEEVLNTIEAFSIVFSEYIGK